MAADAGIIAPGLIAPGLLAAGCGVSGNLRSWTTMDQISTHQSAPSARDAASPTPKRHRLRRTRLIGCFHFMMVSANTAGTEKIVSGQKKSNRSGIDNAQVSYNIRELSE